MKAFVYSSRFEPGDKRGIVVNFPDMPEAVTQGDAEADAHSQAAEALSALPACAARDLPLPRAKKHAGLVPVAVGPGVAAKLAVMDAVRAAGITKSEFCAPSRRGREGRPASSVRNIQRNSLH